MVDAAHFKQISDGFGHAAGDAALATSGARLTSWAGLRAAAGRLGGDEFAVILELVPGSRDQHLQLPVRILNTPASPDDGRTAGVSPRRSAPPPRRTGHPGPEHGTEGADSVHTQNCHRHLSCAGAGWAYGSILDTTGREASECLDKM
ncbi:diguanylate cyclase domain-containing protein [Streptomyces sp. NPDC058869]|uniref:diguanylate cyclase domain-containing protein n=1 Tax=Streptomyces sp. NPDC058869 TaxID=3346659 RepID=UPI0036CA0E72